VEQCWDLHDIFEYENALVELFCSNLESQSSVTLVDCGADIGLFSAVVCSRCDRIVRVVAFEPNPTIQSIFRRNIEALPSGEPYASAVSSFEGFGRLDNPLYDDTDQGRYLVPTQSGITVRTLDSLNIFGGSIAIKIDVEGGELDVLHGASKTIRRASQCVLSLEAHPKVVGRTNIKPSACMEFLTSIRPFRFTVAETRRVVGPTDDVVDPVRVLNVVAVTVND
jgi:FkbM family methyltransferase